MYICIPAPNPASSTAIESEFCSHHRPTERRRTSANRWETFWRSWWRDYPSGCLRRRIRRRRREECRKDRWRERARWTCKAARRPSSTGRRFPAACAGSLGGEWWGIFGRSSPRRRRLSNCICWDSKCCVEVTLIRRLLRLSWGDLGIGCGWWRGRWDPLRPDGGGTPGVRGGELIEIRICLCENQSTTT